MSVTRKDFQIIAEAIAEIIAEGSTEVDAFRFDAHMYELNRNYKPTVFWDTVQKLVGEILGEEE